MFLYENTVLEIWLYHQLNRGLNLTIFRGTGPRIILRGCCLLPFFGNINKLISKDHPLAISNIDIFFFITQLLKDTFSFFFILI